MNEPTAGGRSEPRPWDVAPVGQTVGHDRHVLRRWWAGRFGLALLEEAATVVVLLAVYDAGRSITADAASQAFANAHRVLLVESLAGLAIEDEVQRLVISHEWLVGALNQYYVRVHFPATLAFFVVMYLWRPDHYRPIRRTFVIVTTAALAVHVAFPLAPPRMLPGFVDTISVWGPAIYDDPRVAEMANQFAAMPSLHFGWAVLVAWGIVAMTTGPWRWLVLAHPALTLLTIVATANHYWLDAAVVLVLVGAGVALTGRSLPGSAGPATSDGSALGRLAVEAHRPRRRHHEDPEAPQKRQPDGAEHGRPGR